MKSYRLFVIFCAAAMLLALTSDVRVLGHEGPHVQFAHLAPSVPVVDIYVGDHPSVQGLAYQEVSTAVAAEGVELTLQIVPAGGTVADALNTQPIIVTLAVEAEDHFLLALVGSLADQTLTVVALTGELQPIELAVGVASSGNIKVSGAYARPTAAKPVSSMGNMATPEATMAGMGSKMSMSTSAAYMLIENTGDTADKLISVSSNAAELTQLHQTIVENEVAKMQEVTGGLEIPAKGSAELKPGSYHIMLMQLHRDLVVGDLIKVTLTFESGTTLEVTVPVKHM
jgi:periplasmic copper chaperone A